MEPPSPTPSYKAYEALLLAKTTTTPSSLPATDVFTLTAANAEQAMSQITKPRAMIEGYRKFLATFKAEKGPELAKTIWSSPPSQQTACAFTPLVPPPSGHTSHPNHANNANHMLAQIRDARNLTRFQFP
ncbi:hypothetical protein TNCV_3960121 [Trichonephila clavipes]|nr:hypothetical protein TNCV_3960121 [Trichonephila clavipes]